MIPFNHRAVSITFSRTLLSMLFVGVLLIASSQKIQALGTFIPAASRIDMVYDSARDVLYVTNGDSVLRYQVGSNTFLSPFTITGSNLSGIDLSPDGNALVVADKRRLDPFVWVYAIDLPTGQTRQVLMTRAFMEGGTYAVAYAKDGTVLTTSIFEGSGWIPLRRLNPISGDWSELAQVRNNSMVTSSGDLGIIGYADRKSVV